MSMGLLLLQGVANRLVKFATTLFLDGNDTGIEVPADVVLALDAGKRPLVVMTVNGYEYRSTIAAMGGRIQVESREAPRKSAACCQITQKVSLMTSSARS